MLPRLLWCWIFPLFFVLFNIAYAHPINEITSKSSATIAPESTPVVICTPLSYSNSTSRAIKFILQHANESAVPVETFYPELILLIDAVAFRENPYFVVRTVLHFLHEHLHDLHPELIFLTPHKVISFRVTSVTMETLASVTESVMKLVMENLEPSPLIATTRSIAPFVRIVSQIYQGLNTLSRRLFVIASSYERNIALWRELLLKPVPHLQLLFVVVSSQNILPVPELSVVCYEAGQFQSRYDHHLLHHRPSHMVGLLTQMDMDAPFLTRKLWMEVISQLVYIENFHQKQEKRGDANLVENISLEPILIVDASRLNGTVIEQYPRLSIFGPNKTLVYSGTKSIFNQEQELGMNEKHRLLSETVARVNQIVLLKPSAAIQPLELLENYIFADASWSYYSPKLFTIVTTAEQAAICFEQWIHWNFNQTYLHLMVMDTTNAFVMSFRHWTLTMKLMVMKFTLDSQVIWGYFDKEKEISVIISLVNEDRSQIELSTALKSFHILPEWHQMWFEKKPAELAIPIRAWREPLMLMDAEGLRDLDWHLVLQGDIWPTFGNHRFVMGCVGGSREPVSDAAWEESVTSCLSEFRSDIDDNDISSLLQSLQFMLKDADLLFTPVTLITRSDRLKLLVNQLKVSPMPQLQLFVVLVDKEMNADSDWIQLHRLDSLTGETESVFVFDQQEMTLIARHIQTDSFVSRWVPLVAQFSWFDLVAFKQEKAKTLQNYFDSLLPQFE